MADDENKLSKSELDELLKEVEESRQPIIKTENTNKKKKTVRIDMIVAAVVALIVLAAVVLAIVHFVGNSKTKEEKAVEANPLQDEEYPEISDVIKNYLNAFLIEDDTQRAEVIAQYVGNLYDINSVKKKTNYITGYSAIECYTKNGPYENTYIVYAYYHMGIKNIDTTVPSIDTFYVVRDTNTGKVYIQNDSGSDIQQYIEKITKDSDVQELLKEVWAEYDEVKKSDPKVKEYFDNIEVETTSKGEK